MNNKCAYVLTNKHKWCSIVLSKQKQKLTLTI